MKIKILFVAILLISCIACNSKSNGTNTGNPGNSGNTPVDAPNSGISPETYAFQISNQICTTLSKCFTGVDKIICDQQVKTISGITNELGLATSYSDLIALNSAEKSNAVVVNSTNAHACIDAIYVAECADERVQASYSIIQAGNYYNSYYLLRISSYCASIYSIPQ